LRRGFGIALIVRRAHGMIAAPAVPAIRKESGFVPSSILAATKPALLFAALLCALSGAASAASESSFHLSCRHIGVAGKTLYAECRRINGAFKLTALPIGGIENHNGALQLTSMFQASTYQDSCTDIEVAENVLSARCRRVDGGFTRTSIPIPGIENIDGDLRYRH
jgi:CVNH domain